MSFVRRLPPVLACLAMVSCSDGTGPEAGGCTDETGSVTVTVTSGVAPTFDWDPPCAAWLMLVEQDATDWWILEGATGTPGDFEKANLITPPLTYGLAPSTTGVFETDDPEPLVSGVTYELVLWRILEEGSTANCLMHTDNGCLLAAEAFVY